MNRPPSFLPTPFPVLVEALEPRIAPAGLLNESKFTSVVVGGTVLLDASGGPNDFQGLSTGFGSNSGTYLLYLVTGKALVYTTDLNGDGKFEPGEITGISLGVDSQGRAPSLLLFSDVHGDIATNLLPGHGVSALTDSDNNPTNGRDGRVLLPTDIAGITLRTITSADIDTTVLGNTVDNRLGLTSFSIFGNIYCGGNFGGLTIDTSGDGDLSTKFSGATGIERYVSATPQVGSIETGSAASGQSFHFTQNATNNIDGTFQTFTEPAGQHGGDITDIAAASPSTIYSIGAIISGAGGVGARGGDISHVVLNGDTGSYEVIAGDGGSGATGGAGGSITDFNDLGSITGQVILHTGAGGTGTLGAGGAGGVATFANASIAASVEVFLGNGGDGATAGGNGSSLTSLVITAPDPTLPIGSHFLGTWHDLGDIGNTHRNADGTYSPEVINFNDPSFFSTPAQAATSGDTYGDGVFTTNTPGQVEVVFGDGFGGLNDNGGQFNLSGQETVYLRVPGVVNPVVTVGDFNGDGRPDIAVASGALNSFAGVYIFLDQIGTPMDPIGTHNFSKNPLGDHPFSEALQSAVPSLTDALGAFVGPAPSLALTTGDFNGDGIADIGIVQTVTLINSPPIPGHATGILFGSAAHNADGSAAINMVNGVARNAGTGFFHANSAAPGAASTLQFTVTTMDPSDVYILQSTSLTSGNGIGSSTTAVRALAAPEVFISDNQGGKVVNLVSVGVDPVTHAPLSLYVNFSPISLGGVDTNRSLSTPTANNVSFTTALTIQDFTIVDLDNNGTADLVFLTKSPLEFLTTASGDGFGNFITASNNPSAPRVNDNDGIFLGGAVGTVIVAVDTDNTDTVGDGNFNEFAILQFPAGKPPVVNEYRISLHPTDGTLFDSMDGLKAFGSLGIFAPDIISPNPNIQGLDAFYVNVPSASTTLHPATGFGLISPDSTDVNNADLFIATSENFFDVRYLTENGYFLNAGRGGGSAAGTGGNGGVIGNTSVAVGSSDGVGAIQITFPASLTYAGHAYLLAGDGGTGFAGGGSGGNVEGVLVRYAAGTTVQHSSVVLSAGNGGSSLAATGGAGGGVADVSVTSGVYFSAGNGGSGVNGGAGGNIVGNGVATSYDTTDAGTELSPVESVAIGFGAFGGFLDGVGLGAGNGGAGSNVGGQGGSITNWNSVFSEVIGGTGGSLYYAGGIGGTAASGVGGAGGSIINSSPNTQQNNLSGDLHLQSGGGGAGLTGGDAGSITTFVNQPTDQTAVPGLLSVTAGAGGTGVVGSGGVGGSITGFNSNATGLISFDGEALLGLGRVIAGDGGASYGGQGGNGGTISNITAQTTSTPIIVAAGAGGVGLTVGGEGGAVLNSVINSAAQQIGKVLVVAGVGGDASSALPSEVSLAGDGNAADSAHLFLAYGGVSAHAGDGGDISKITQPISTQTAVDLIAGNGGSTLNAGTSLDLTTGVGRGGSVVDVNLAGTVGAVSRNTTAGAVSNPPIQAYAATTTTYQSDDMGDITLASFTTTTLPISQVVDLLTNPAGNVLSFNDNASTTPNSFENGFVSTNISGNVGIVAGAAGRVRNDQPARDGLNGTAQNITAESIMSIVAGSISSVAPVSILSGITVTDPDGVLGVDRTPVTAINANSSPNGILDYFTPNGTDVTNLQAGYSLVNADGALFAISIQQTSGTILTGPRVFQVSNT